MERTILGLLVGDRLKSTQKQMVRMGKAMCVLDENLMGVRLKHRFLSLGSIFICRCE